MEHIFHVPNYLENVYDLLKLEGHFLKVVPCNNWVNHGFFQFSPTLQNDYFEQNSWKVLERWLIDIDDHWPSSLRVQKFSCAKEAVRPIRQSGDRFYFSAILVEKTYLSTCKVIPQQYTYLHDQWGQKS
jgi:hypothetical protein